MDMIPPEIPHFMADSRRHKERKESQYEATRKVVYAHSYAQHFKPFINEIRAALAQHYRFTDDKLDFITNYDIKYRMGQEAEDADEE